MSMPDDAKVIAAAQAAAAHDMILKLPDGYDTRVSAVSGRLSGGQINIRTGRALYGEPVVVVLDEPNSSLDNEGSIALNQADQNPQSRRQIVMARPSCDPRECDVLLVIKKTAFPPCFGPRRSTGKWSKTR
jgi:ATP-binding cassette subfamily C protein